MNQRMAFAAMAILLAAHLLSGSRSPASAALAGTYVASDALRAESYVLTLAADSSATLSTTPLGGTSAPHTVTGSWILEGSSVQVAFADSADQTGATAVTFELRDGVLVAKPKDADVSRFANLEFVRLAPLPDDARPK